MKKTVLITIWTSIAVHILLAYISPYIFWYTVFAFIWYKWGKKAGTLAKEFLESEVEGQGVDFLGQERANNIIGASAWWGLPMLVDACNLTDKCILKEAIPSFIRNSIPSIRSPFKF